MWFTNEVYFRVWSLEKDQSDLASALLGTVSCDCSVRWRALFGAVRRATELDFKVRLQIQAINQDPSQPMSNQVHQKSSVSEWMLHPVHSVARETSIREVLEIMRREGLACVPVTNGAGPVVGIVTLGDLARVVLSTDELLDSDFPHYEDCFWAVDLIQKRLGSDKVTTVMSENVVTISPQTSMQGAAKQMAKESVRHLAVTHSGELLGMLSATDFVRMVAGD